MIVFIGLWIVTFCVFIYGLYTDDLSLIMETTITLGCLTLLVEFCG